MESFANEIIEKILCQKQLSFCDIINFAKTAKRFYNLIKNNEKIWKFVKQNLLDKRNVLYNYNNWHLIIGNIKIKYANVYEENRALIIDDNDDVFHIIYANIEKIDSLCKKGIHKLSIFTFGFGHYGHFLAVNKSGEIFGFGNNEYKQIMDSDEREIKIPQKIPFKGNVIEIKRGMFHTMALTDNSEVYTWGRNWDGTTITESPFHVKIDETSHIKSIVCGYSHSMVLYENGTVYGWGRNDFGQLGLGMNESQSKPQKVFENVKRIICGYDHTLMMTYDGTVYSMGYNRYGQLGNGKTLKENVPQKIDMKFKIIDACKNTSMGMDENGDCYVWGRILYDKNIINEKIEKIPAKVEFHSFNEIFESIWGITNETIETEYNCFCQLCLTEMKRIKC